MKLKIWFHRHILPIATLALGLAILPGYLRAFKVATPSMAPSKNVGDSFLVNEASYTLRLPYSEKALARIGSPRRGEMIQLQFPDSTKLGIKRVIGLPGETVEFRENRVLIDGRMLPLTPLDRASFNWIAPSNNLGSAVYNEDGHWITFTPGKSPYRNAPPLTLAAHQYFVAGDNRDGSIDSRIWGPIPENRILGKVLMTYMRGK